MKFEKKKSSGAPPRPSQRKSVIPSRSSKLCPQELRDGTRRLKTRGKNIAQEQSCPEASRRSQTGKQVLQ